MTRGGRCLAVLVICLSGLLTATASGGEVTAGTAAVGTFVFHNDGDRDVTILRAKPS